MSSHELKITDDHNTIKKWVEERNAGPALIEGVVDKGKGGGMLRIDFRDNSEGQLTEISWEQFFEIFDESKLEFQYQEKSEDGGKGKFCKFINKG